ncbi:glycosyltransferase [Calidifontibacter sp. DB0510]|uniref:Glycosyltransferase n=2 Tax=Metallococcus carri TaxID=1656884 RepID=A0A967AZB3_9MICO|nr:glycosyltransferase [Metallococcus carri]NOP36571.1 glycosyltransferase [Calidifontibacter sp. DB2511S]
MGERLDVLATALNSVHAQQGVELDIVVVGNGWQPTGLPDWVRTVYQPTNLGIPGGRNVGAKEARGDYLFFYDDDATLPRTDTLARMVAEMDQDPRNAVIGPRGQDPTGKPTPRRWIPRLNVKNGGKAGPATWFLEGIHLSRRIAFEQVGGWPDDFFFGHEGIDLAWRLIDAGWLIQYVPSIVVNHPATPDNRHPRYLAYTARNRVWVARRNLPAPLVPIYLADWAAITVLRGRRNPQDLKVWFNGFRDGLRQPAGPRRPISWRTVAELTRLGRPPVL